MEACRQFIDGNKFLFLFFYFKGLKRQLGNPFLYDLHCHFARSSFPLTVGSVVLTNFVVRFSMTPAMRMTSHVSKMAACRPQRMFSAQEVVQLVLQSGSDEEEDVVGAFSDSDRELLDSDDNYIPVHDDEWSDVSEFFCFF